MELKPTFKEVELPEKEKTYTKEEIEREICAVREKYKQVQEMREVAKEARQRLQEMVLCADMPLQDLQTFVFNTYWFCKAEVNATSLQSLVETKLGKEKWQDFVSATLDMTCSKCHESIIITVKSRTQLDRINRTAKFLVCDKCKEIEQKEIALASMAAINQTMSTTESFKQMSYSEYLQTNHWQKIRRQALKRAKYKCQLCSKHNTELHVHHKTYEHIGQEHNYQDDLIVLCKDCHAKFHGKDE